MQLGTFFNQIDSAVKNDEVKSIEEALEILTPKGLSFVDVYATLLQEKYQAKTLFLRLKQYGVFVASVFHITEFEYERENILAILKEDAKHRLEECAELECKMFMPVPTVGQVHRTENDRSICRDKIVEHVAEVADLAKAYGIQVVIENFSDTKTPFSTIDDVSYILGQLPEVGYVLDTGNFWFGGSDVLQAAKRFAERTVHVHLKDIFPKKEGALNICGRSADSVAMGVGVIPFKKIYEILQNTGYDKMATIELNASNCAMNKMLESLCYMSKLD